MKIISASNISQESETEALAETAWVEGPHRILAHSHDRAQLIHSSEGRLVVEVEERIWLVTPQTALWIPAGSLHSISASESVQYVSLFVDNQVAQGISENVQAVLMQPLLRQLTLTAAEFSRTVEVGSAESRMIGVILDQLHTIESGDLVLPLPKDKRLKNEVAKLIQRPCRDQDMKVIAANANMSVRTLERIFKKETAMNFKRWRRRLLVLRAIELLYMDYSVKFVAMELGYSSTSAFISMFKDVIGATPASYIASQKNPS